MGSIAQDLPYIKTNPKIIFFTDFDGTITIEDSKSLRCNPVSKHGWLKAAYRQ